MTAALAETAGGELLGSLFSTTPMRACFSDRARLQGMLDFEAALAQAEAHCGVIPPEVAPLIASFCRAELFDIAALAAAVPLAGNIAIPLVKQLTAHVAREHHHAAAYVHWGATSQDAIDTGLMLQLRRAQGLLESDCLRACAAAATLARRHADDVMPGRTWLQHATPITFGLKAAHWLDVLQRDAQRLARLRALLVLQFGGAAGTLAALGENASPVRAALGEELDLPVPPIDWHTQRDRVVEFATALGLVAGNAGKIARDLVLMMQTEVGEVSEGLAPGAGGSSTMPHKRNPVTSVAIIGAAERAPGLVATLLYAMSQEHERGAGGWHAEWESLPQLCMLAGGVLAHLAAVLDALEVHPERMRRNLDMLGGLNLAEAVSMALAEHVGRADAHAIVEAACRTSLAEQRPLAQVLGADARVNAHFDAARIASLLDPARYLGAAREMIDAVLADHDRRSTR